MNVKHLKLRPKSLPTLFLPTGKTRKESLLASKRTRECQSVAIELAPLSPIASVPLAAQLEDSFWDWQEDDDEEEQPAEHDTTYMPSFNDTISSQVCRCDFTVRGILLIVEGACPQDHHFKWRSQLFLGGNPAGILHLAAGILFSGCPVAASLRCLGFINVQAISHRTFYNYQRGLLLPAINELFQQRQALLLAELNCVAVDLAGDGRCDSPDNSAKYLTYSVLATQLGPIIYAAQVQVGESPAVPNSVSMEKRGLIKCVDALEENGIVLKSLPQVLFQPHPGVRSYCRVSRPHMTHWYDVWHVAKGLKKKLGALSKKHPIIAEWSQCIVNHLYWVAGAGEGNGVLVVSMWRSLLNHICNVHEGHDRPYCKCMHGPMGHRHWMKPSK
ncbi:uncharacterized protein LOC144120179 [Amblyomma americanum]